MATHLAGFDVTAVGCPGDDHRYVVTEAALEAYAEATNDVPGGPVFAVVPTWAAIAPASRSVASDEARRYVVHYEQDIVVPQQLSVPEVTLAVGVGREAVQLTGKEIEGLAGSRLEILSGVSDGQDRALIARLATGVVPGQKNDPRGERRRPGERRPGLPPGAAGRDRPLRPGLPSLVPGQPQVKSAGADLKEKP